MSEQVDQQGENHKSEIKLMRENIPSYHDDVS